MTTMNTVVALEHVTCWCGAPMAIPAGLIKNAKETGQELYCPATGHRFHWDSENDKLRRRLDAQRARTTAALDQLAAAERQNSALKGQVTKARRRAAAGVCPCCKRSFVQLSRHMATKHPDFGTEEVR